jgi:hypothetical protein
MKHDAEKAGISDETFDEFPATGDMLTICEDDAMSEIMADQEPNG